jgi:oxygen-independent coproporphyrinogen-3 oxidase
VDTIFIGGGTPTRLSAEQLTRLLGSIRRWFPLAEGGEWTVEANPETVDERKADALAEGGVNRVSMGAQSFRPDALRALERDHDPEDVPKAIDLVRPRFDRWSFDLIFGAPGSTLEDWKSDVDRALSLGPSHLSCYGLTYEKGTSLHKQWREGLVRSVDEEVERAMFEHTMDRLEAAGLPQYEISNFARPGEESRHNLVYWANEPYFGIGVGAARFMDGVRASNTRDLMAYLKRIESGVEAIGPSERLGPEEHARETIVLMLRRTRIGLVRDDFERRTGYVFDDLGAEALARNLRRGWLEDDGARVRLTREGLFVADTVLSDFL